MAEGKRIKKSSLYRLAPKTEGVGVRRGRGGKEVEAGCIVHSLRRFGHKGKENLRKLRKLEISLQGRPL